MGRTAEEEAVGGRGEGEPMARQAQGGWGGGCWWFCPQGCVGKASRQGEMESAGEAVSVASQGQGSPLGPQPLRQGLWVSPEPEHS